MADILVFFGLDSNLPLVVSLTVKYSLKYEPKGANLNKNESPFEISCMAFQDKLN